MFWALSPMISEKLPFALFENEEKVSFHGAGWIQGGRIMSASDTITGGQRYKGNWLENSGALFNTVINFDEELEGSFGIGAIKTQTKPMGSFNFGELTTSCGVGSNR